MSGRKAGFTRHCRLDVDQHTSNTSCGPQDSQLFLSLAFAPSRFPVCLFEFVSGHLTAEAGFDNSEVHLPSMAPFSPSDVGSLKPSTVLLRGCSVGPPNLAAISCSITSRTCDFLKLRNPRALSPSLHAISSSTHLGFSIVSSRTYPKQNVQRYLTSPQLVFPI
jgi:hypothetical protein